MNLTLTRQLFTDAATSGRLQAGLVWFFTIELTWRANEKGESCVPLGQYKLIPYLSPKHHGPTWCLHNPLLNVYGTSPAPDDARTFCEIHAANFGPQLQGCIAVGLGGTPMLDPITHVVEPAVEDSRDAMAELLTALGPMSSGHTLSIVSDGVLET